MIVWKFNIIFCMNNTRFLTQILNHVQLFKVQLNQIYIGIYIYIFNLVYFVKLRRIYVTHVPWEPFHSAVLYGIYLCYFLFCLFFVCKELCTAVITFIVIFCSHISFIISMSFCVQFQEISWWNALMVGTCISLLIK